MIFNLHLINKNLKIVSKNVIIPIIIHTPQFLNKLASTLTNGKLPNENYL
jgi:hypothetical protein